MNMKVFKGGYDSNLTYLIWNSNEAILIDPGVPSEEVLEFIFHNKLVLRGVFVMHSHFDHIIELNKYNSKIFAFESSPIEKDKPLKNNQTISLAGFKIKVLHTPGHCSDSICLLIDNKLFTSDTLFVGSIGRTDLEGADDKEMKASLELIKDLPSETEVYPGHDYGIKPKSTIGYERVHNPFLR